MIWDKISYYDTTGPIIVNATPTPQPYCEGIVVPGLVPFRNQGHVNYIVPYFNKITLESTPQDRPMKFYCKAISIH
jgi:hypothetical protein